MFILGIDVGKSDLFCRLLKCTEQNTHKVGSVQRFPNTTEGREHLKSWLAGHQALGNMTHAVMEATGVYSQHIAHTLHVEGCQVSVVNAAQIKFFAMSTLRRGKTDPMDAELIAQYGATMKPPLWQPTRLELEELRALLSEREMLVSMITLEKSRLHAFDHQKHPCEVVLRLNQDRLKMLEEQLLEVEEHIQKTIRSDLLLGGQIKLLMSIPGIGLLTAATLLAETHHLEDLQNARQWSAYAGLSPVPRQSGQMVKRSKISKAGNRRIRYFLYMAAVTVARLNTQQSAFYRRLVDAGKPKKVALIAVARKLLRICFAVLRSGEPYAKGHRSQLASPA